MEEAYRINEENGNNFWHHAIEKEMSRVCVAFEKWQGGMNKEEAKRKLVIKQQITGHLVFDIHLEGLVQKARYVASGNKTKAPSSITYSSIVSRDSVWIAFLVAALNDLNIMAADIGNVYLNAPCHEKVWLIAGPEFGDEEGSVFLIVHALYGLKSVGSSWQLFFSSFTGS